MSDSVNDERDQLIALSVEPCFKDYSQKTLGFSVFESTTNLEIKGKTLAIAEIPIHLNTNVLPRYKYLDELVTQHLKPQRQFVCLSNNGIHILVFFSHLIFKSQN
jgi:hypothetical protein